ncbi:MAG: hypothetical protein ACPLW7_01720 [Minisyncoccia bacterium]
MMERFYQIIGDAILKAFNSNLFHKAPNQDLKGILQVLNLSYIEVSIIDFE